MPKCTHPNCNKSLKGSFFNPDKCGNHRPRYPTKNLVKSNKIYDLSINSGATYHEQQQALKKINKYYSIAEEDFEKIINTFLGDLSI